MRSRENLTAMADDELDDVMRVWEEERKRRANRDEIVVEGNDVYQVPEVK